MRWERRYVIRCQLLSTAEGSLLQQTDRAIAFVSQIFWPGLRGVIDPVIIFLSSALITTQHLVAVCAIPYGRSPKTLDALGPVPCDGAWMTR